MRTGVGRVALVGVALAVMGSALSPVASGEDVVVPNVYVALGDSYTAGPLVLLPTGDPIDCGRSTANYPHLVAKAIQAPVFRDVSCGSARTDHFAEPQSGLPLGGTNPPQYEALGPEVALVTVGIGGNDMGFTGAADRCIQVPVALGGEPCSEYYTRDGGDYFSSRIAQTAPKVDTALKEIRRLAPNAAILLLGYPSVFPHDGSGCYPYLPILPEDMPYLRDKMLELNAMLKLQAESNGAVYVDWYRPSIGHDMCQPPGIAWTNGVVVVPPSYPAHPNAAGLSGAARAVLFELLRVGFRWPTS